MDWRAVMVAAGLAIVGCQGTPTGAGVKDTTATTASNDPYARVFSGILVGARPTISTLLVTKEERIGKDRVPSQVVVKYDANTQFFLDGKPATLDQIFQYMSVTIEGRMRDGRMFAEKASFSSALPTNVKRAGN
jgi:hypothetical protein